MIHVKVAPFLIEVDGAREELVCKMTILKDGRWVSSRFVRFDATYTYDDIEAEVAGMTEADRVDMQYAWAIERVNVKREWHV